MKKLQLLIFVFITFSFWACETSFYKKFQTIPNKQWKRAESVKFELDAQDTTTKFNISAAFRYSPIINHNAIKIDFTITTPSGKSESKTHIIAIKGADGKQLGEAMGDIADIKGVALANYTFAEKGKYVFEIKHGMPPEEVGGVYEVGVIVDKL